MHQHQLLPAKVVTITKTSGSFGAIIFGSTTKPLHYTSKSSIYKYENISV